jgi:hypothetical protein
MVRILSKAIFAGCSSLCSVVFESESSLENIESDAFYGCKALESLCLPASLIVLSEHSLRGMRLLKSLTFESESKLREIQNWALCGCESLRSIFLPASLAVIGPYAFFESSIEEVFVDDSNPHFFFSRQFLIGVDGMILVRYFGDGEDLKADCLSDLGLRQIGSCAFSHCPALKSILIPADIEILGDHSFDGCTSLSEIIFESGSKLTQMVGSVFVGCSSLASICIPAGVDKIPSECFRQCKSLVEVSFEPGSKLSRIGYMAFMCCGSLRSLVLPAELDIMASGALSDCRSLCELIFVLPSRLRQLDLPPSRFGSLVIPDCVEVVFGEIGKQEGQLRILHFGRESCLKKLSLRESVGPWITDQNSDTVGDSFVHLSRGVLRRFRCKFEC